MVLGRLKSNPNEPWGMGAGQPAPEPSGFLPSDRRLRIDVMLKNETNRCLEELRALASRREGAGSTHGPTRRMLVVGRFRSHGWRVPIGRPVTRSARGGFTLVEMLTVIAIVAVLATLLASGLSAAKRKAHQAACTSHLRQISLALNMYLDDHSKRPQALGDLVLSQYLPALPVLLCPADKSGNWGGLIQGDAVPGSGSSFSAHIGKPESVPETEIAGNSVPYSYFHPLGWEEALWIRLFKADPNAGIAACQLHGIGRADLEAPSEQDFEGLVLRAQLDGAVVRPCLPGPWGLLRKPRVWKVGRRWGLRRRPPLGPENPGPGAS
jgi:prepilin-type N-terminal cleavage/methylation domain-containing protein